MTTAAEEALKLITDFNTSDAQSLALVGQQQAAQRSFLQSSNQVAAQTKTQIAQQAAQQADLDAATVLIQGEAAKLGLNPEQQFLSRVSGDFDATLDYRLDKLAQRTRDDDQRRRVLLAKALLAQDNELFRQANPDAGVVDYNSIGQERREELASSDGIGGFVGKAAATAVAGIPGFAGILAGSAGFEDFAQTLGGAANTVAKLAPTDLGSEAASLQYSDIKARINSGEIGLGEGVRQLASLASDGDFVADVAATTLGATAGGGVVRRVAGLGARALGSLTNTVARSAAQAARAPALGSLTNTVARGAAQAAPAVGVGLGAGIDKTITTPEAQVLAVTGGLSALTSGFTAGLGGQVAETALGQLGRRFTPGVISPTTGARTVGGTLTPLTRGQATSQVAGRTVASAAGEATQEFIEGGGESLAQAARGGFDQVGPEDVRSAVIDGTLNAAIGAGIGGAVGAPNAALQARATNLATTNALEERQAQVEQGAQRATELDLANPDLQGLVQTELGNIQTEALAENQQRVATDTATAQVQQEVADQQLVEARAQELNSEATEAFGIVPPATADTPRNRIGQRIPVIATLANFLDTDPNRDVAEFVSTFERFQNDAPALRALYRNQVAQNPELLQSGNETSFVAALQAIPDTASAAQIRQTINQAFIAAGNAPITQSTAGQSSELRQVLSDQAVQGFIQGVAEAPASEVATDPTPVNTLLANASADLEALAQATSDRNQSEADRTQIAQESSAAAVATEQANTQAQQAAVQQVFANNFEVPDTQGATRGELRAVRSPVANIDNTLGATDETVSDEAFARLFVDSPSSTQVSALEGLIRNTVPDINAQQASQIASRIVDATDAEGDALTKETALSVVQEAIASARLQPAPANNDTNPDPDPPAAAAPAAPILQEETRAVFADAVFDESGQIAARYQDDFARLSSIASPSNTDLKAYRDGGKLLDQDGVPGFKPKTLRTLAQKAREARVKLADGETLTPSEQGTLVNALDKYRRAIARGKPEASAEGASVSDGVEKRFTEQSSEDGLGFLEAPLESGERANFRTPVNVPTPTEETFLDQFELDRYTYSVLRDEINSRPDIQKVTPLVSQVDAVINEAIRLASNGDNSFGSRQQLPFRAVAALDQAIDNLSGQLIQQNNSLNRETRSRNQRDIQEDGNDSFDPANPNIRASRARPLTDPDTPEFKAFFKNSKVVDSEGKPLAVYHGTPWTIGRNFRGPFTDPQGFRARLSGIFFAGTRKTSRGFTDLLIPNIQQVYLSVQNPIVIEPDLNNSPSLPFSKLENSPSPVVKELLELQRDLPEVDPGRFEQLKQVLHIPEGAVFDFSRLHIDSLQLLGEPLGYDGAIVRQVEDVTVNQLPGFKSKSVVDDQYVVFKPTQIKSATNNSGDFDPANPDIRASRVAQPASAASVRSTDTHGLLPEGVTDQVQQFSIEGVQSSVDAITADWKASPPIVVVQSTTDLPEALQDGNENAGMTDGNTMYLIADNLQSGSQIAETLLEETFHRGIQKFLGGSYDSELDRIYKQRGGVSGMLRLVAQFGGRSDFVEAYRDVITQAQAGNKEAQRELVDEALAQIALNPNLPSGPKAALKRIAAKIKRAVSKVFPKLLERVSDNDLHQLVRNANNAGRSSGDVDAPRRIRARAKLGPAQYFGTGADGTRQRFTVGNGEGSIDPSLRDSFINTVDAAKERLTKTRANGLGKALYRNKAWQGLITRIDNSRFAVQRVESELDFATPEQAVSVFDEIKAQDNVPDMFKALVNRATDDVQKRSLLAVNSLLTTYSSRGSYLAKKDLIVNENGDTLFTAMQRFSEAKGAIQDIEGINDTEANQVIGLYANALHAKERNYIAWIKGVGLSDSNAIAQRQEIIQRIGDNSATPADIRTLRSLADQFAVTPRADFVGSGMSDAEADQVIANIENDSSKAPLYREAVAKLQELQQAANEIKKQTGSFSTSLQSTINLYGWQNYVPLRGRGIDPDEDLDDAFIAYHGDNVFSTTFRAFEGRESLAEDVVGNVYKNAISAVEQNAAQQFIESVAIHAQGASTSEGYSQVFKLDGFEGKLLEGTLREFDINSPAFKSLVKTKNPANLILYDADNRNNPDNQRALVITLAHPEGVDAILGAKSNLAENIDNLLRKATIGGKSVHDVTQVTSSLKTFRALPFIPFDALRNILTLGFITAVDRGVPGLQNYIGQFTQPGTNYGSDIFKFVNLYTDNKFAEIDQLVSAKPNGIFAELDEFYRLGGPVNFLSAIRERAPGSLEAIGEETRVGGTGLKAGAQKRLRQADAIFTKLNMAADTLSRFAFYKSLLDQGLPPEVAAARAKNTANFENRGTWSGPLGGLFEFFRPSATGSISLINSTLTGKYGLHTAAAAFGAGAGLYIVASMLAGTDDEGDDRMAQVNGALFNSNFVFQYGDDDSDRLQLGLGFGPIASSISAGIHAARLMLGHAGIESTLKNITAGIASQYQVLPVSSISPLDTLDFVSSSITPSIIKPWAEVSRNLTSLGITVRSDYAGADTGDLTGSFAGRYNSEQEMYELITQGLRNSGFANINPDDFRHIMRSYGGTLAHLAEAVFENIQAATSEDYAYNKKQGLYVVRQFFGSTYSQRPADFYEHYKRVEDLHLQANKFDQAGNSEAAEAIRNSEIYANNFTLYQAAKKEINAINTEYRPVFRSDATTTAEKRRAEQERTARLDQVYRDYLDQIR